MALAAPRGSSRSLPAPARLLPAPLSGPPRPQPPPPGRSAAGRGAGSGGRSRSGPRPSQRTLGGAAPGRAWRRGALEGSVCPYPLKTAPPRPAPAGWDAQRMLGKFPCWGGSGGPRPDSGSLPQLGSWACVPHGWRLSPRQRLTTSCSPSCLPQTSCIKHRGGQPLSPTLPGLHCRNATYPKQEFKSSISVPEY